jgi:hypothetical protein
MQLLPFVPRMLAVGRAQFAASWMSNPLPGNVPKRQLFPIAHSTPTSLFEQQVSAQTPETQSPERHAGPASSAHAVPPGSIPIADRSPSQAGGTQ